MYLWFKPCIFFCHANIRRFITVTLTKLEHHETKDNHILMQSNESETEPSEPTKIFFENDLMWLEFKKPYREIFTRVKISDLIEQYECLEPLLPLRGLPVQ